MVYKKLTYFLLTMVGISSALLFAGVISLRDQKKPDIGEREQSEQESIKQMPTFTMENNKGEYYLRIEEPFRLILPENPTTGYRWEIDESVSSNIVLLRQEYLPGQPTRPKAGGGGTRNMIFRPVDKGTAELVLRLRRPWEAEDSYVDTFIIRFDIE